MPLPPLATLAHELRTPLHGMLGLLDLLRTTPLDAEQRGHVAALDEAAAALLRLTEDALTLTRLDAGALPTAVARCDPREVLAAAARTLAPLAAARALALTIATDADVPTAFRTDAGRLRQILLNLAGNAIKYTRRGSVRLHARRDGDDDLAIDVVDTGPGLTEARRARLFRAWDRLGADDGADAPDGVGIGLVLAGALAAQLGGRIAVASVHGVGSTFTVVLPGG